MYARLIDFILYLLSYQQKITNSRKREKTRLIYHRSERERKQAHLYRKGKKERNKRTYTVGVLFEEKKERRKEKKATQTHLYWRCQ